MDKRQSSKNQILIRADFSFILTRLRKDCARRAMQSLKHGRRYASLLLIALICSGCGSGAFSQQRSKNARFDFALIGDVPYNDFDATNSFPNMIEEINRARLAFVVHDGDIKSGGAPCSDEVFSERYLQFHTFRHPLIYVFGDNEWSDCGKNKTNHFDPEERLDKLREIFTHGNQTLGRRTFTLSRQSDHPPFDKYRENTRWLFGNVLFVGLNLPGDANNYGHPEYSGRMQANLSWLKDSFALARDKNMRALMLIMQANPHFDLPSTNKLRAGFNEFLRALETETVAFKKPVILVHGDSHYFRIDKPMIGSKSKRRVENFTRVETFGNPDVHWLRATVDWRDPNVFSFRQMIVERNLVNHQK